MEIKEIQKGQREEEERRERAIKAKKQANKPKKKKLKPKEEGGKLNKKKIIVYVSIIFVLLTTSSVYNFVQYRMSTQLHPPEDKVSVEDLTIVFYDLCLDIEQNRVDTGEYPASIEDLTFSDHVIYSRGSDDSFQLTYQNHRLDLSYDSRVDSEMIQ
jgi:hypothetical protein